MLLFFQKGLSKVRQMYVSMGELVNWFTCVPTQKNGQQIHMTKKYSLMDMFEGNATLMGDDLVEFDKYAYTCYCWKTDMPQCK